jgi:hypothetical protein
LRRFEETIETSFLVIRSRFTPLKYGLLASTSCGTTEPTHNILFAIAAGAARIVPEPFEIGAAGAIG